MPEHEELAELAAEEIRRRERSKRHRATLEAWPEVGDLAPRRVTISELVALAPEDREAVLGELSDEQARGLLYDWLAWARDEQLPPPSWEFGWLILAGRGFGKTRTGAETVRMEVEAGRAELVALVGRTVADVRQVMVEGPAGLLACYPPEARPSYEPSKRTITWPEEGARFVSGPGYTGGSRRALAVTFSDDVPDQLRGPQHDLAWADEPAAWRNAWAHGGSQAGELPQEGGTWSNLMLGLRMGPRPRWIATTTPKPVKLIRYLVRTGEGVAVTRGSTYANLPNLPDGFVREVLGRYRGTRLERQEIAGELIEELEGALWTFSMLDRARELWARHVAATKRPPAARRIVVAVDPPAESTAEGSVAGIVAAYTLAADPSRAAVYRDASKPNSTPGEWGRAAVDLFHELRADRIVAEVNNGGEMVTHTIRTVDDRVPVKVVRATRGKALRAEPIAALYEQGRIWHAAGLQELEEQMTLWTPDSQESPDRLDAAAWALSELMLDKRGGTIRAY